MGLMPLKGKQLKVLQSLASTCWAICRASTQSTILYPMLSPSGTISAIQTEWIDDYIVDALTITIKFFLHYTWRLGHFV